MQKLLSWIRNLSAVNIERTYKDLDASVAQLRAYNDDPDSVNKEDLDALVNEAIGDANTLLAFKGEKNWDGLFRELHEYLAKIRMELGEYEEAERQARLVLEYDRNEGEYLLKQIEAHKRGERIEDFDPSAVDEGEE